ncbi:PREDICTED: KAT8 regulatory NSL complex subunit 3 isoform X3 [Drosophila arizonae]|uniref:KAT8 regulatory NSL complex subunit 3 isoform X3 n=1 Tax=Drosophila arizonae TaxID=7263 RepID=A0ABM1PHC3_DROAR|nr:PREDICTED: KAT8 regulatory NSL complex subunit 3 isoform X3 [Drosophila arizonae]
MMQIKQTKNNKSEIIMVEKKPKMQSANTNTSIITYSPSKFIARAGTPYTKIQTHTQTHTNTNIARASAPATSAAAITTAKMPTAGTANNSYYVVKAGQLGSAASILSSPPKAATAASAASATISTESTSTISAPSESSMEHTYMRDAPRPENTINNGLAPARTILVRHAPQCPTCHTYPAHEESGDSVQTAHIPVYDEIAAKEMMNECARIAKYVRNNNSDDQDWQERINRTGWTTMQQTLFDKVATILDQDQLARLANDKRQQEVVHRRVAVDKSSSRMRRALASVAWEPRTTQWLHALLMEHLPPSYMASYLDIMQTLKSKVPTLIDKMLFSRPLNNSQELLAPVMKQRWHPDILAKSRHLTHNAIMVAIPNMPTSGPVPQRMQNWYEALASITQIVQITLPNTNDRIGGQNLDQVAETIVSLTRVRIHELRVENPNRGIILIGFNAGSALALQVAMSESVACVICMGFAYNTLRGPRGAPDDRLLDIKAPILFVIGQNSARSSQEEMEGLRERMQSESSLVVVGSADDALRVPKSKRRLEAVTQAMIDFMVVDEVYEFVNKTLSNPPGPRMPTSLLASNSYQRQPKQHQHILADGNVNKAQITQSRKRKANDSGLEDGCMPSKSKIVPHIRISTVGRPRTRPLPGGVPATGIKSNLLEKHVLTNEEMNMSIESMLEETLDYDDNQQPTTGTATTVVKSVQPNVIKPVSTPTTVSLATGTKIKMIPSSQFVQLKSLPAQNKLVNYTIGKGSNAATAASTSIGSIVKTLPPSSGQQIFTLKAPSGVTTQFVTAAAANTANASSTAAAAAQQKYTVVKNASGITMLQMTKNMPAAQPTGGSNVDLSNIIDMPIVFADNEGNFAEQQQQQQQQQGDATKTVASSSSSNNPLIISQKIIKEATNSQIKPSSIVTNSKGIVINKGIQQLFTTTGTTGNKLVYLNRSSMKPMGTATGSAPATTSRLSNGTTPLPIRIVSNPKPAIGTGNPLLIDGANMKTLNLQAIKTTGGTPVINAGTAGALRLGNKTYPQFQVINSPVVGPGMTGDGKQQQQQLRNVYIKSATGLKPVQMLTNRAQAIPAIAPGGAAVRRVLNIGPYSKPTTVTVNSQAIKDSKIIKASATTTASATIVTPATTTANSIGTLPQSKGLE